MTNYRLDKMIGKLRCETPILRPELKTEIMAVVNASGFSRRPAFVWRYAAGFAVILLFGVGGTVFAAQRALPGNVLYPVKRASETAFVKVQVTPPAKAVAQEMIIQRRFDEADWMADLGGDYDLDVEDRLADEAMAANEAWIDMQERMFSNDIMAASHR